MTASGEAARPNQHGVYISINASNNKIGDGTPAGRNIISGNSSNGILISGSGTNSNEVLGNYIGVSSAGGALANGGNGINIGGGAQLNRVGNGTAGGRNVISGNTSSAGVHFYGSATMYNEVRGNYIGVDPSGGSALANDSGVYIDSGANNNYIGGANTGEGNVISGNSAGGVAITGSGTNSNEVLGNYIGVSSAGSALANGGGGLNITGGAQLNRVGNGTAGGRNIISGNTSPGVYFYGSATMYNEVRGNYIGVDPSGSSALANDSGVGIEGGANNNYIGGSATGEGNIISGNTGQGIFIDGDNTNSNEIKGNYIGTTVSGEAPLANTGAGVRIGTNAKFNKVGGSTAGERNIISGNGAAGVYFETSGTTSNEVTGNYIGTNVSGTAGLGNTTYGVYIVDAQCNKIGGTATGEGNLISGNTNNYGIAINAHRNEVLGNYIGTKANGFEKLGNSDGIWLSATDFNKIGNGTSSGRNIISGNNSHGIVITGSSNEVKGNYIGLGADGQIVVANKYNGIQISAGAQYNLIGTSESGGRNYILASNEATSYGIYLTDSGVMNNYVFNNVIGLTTAESIPASQGNCGIGIAGGANQNYIGGTGAGEGNVISGSSSYGILISGSGTNSNEVLANLIGTDSTGTIDKGNTGDGIRISGGPLYNKIGNGTANGRNIISGNDGHGIYGINAGTNEVRGNYIGTTATGEAALGNDQEGIILETSQFFKIGGATLPERNVISGNGSGGAGGYAGIGLVSSDNNEIKGNYIGLKSSGTGFLANDGSGIKIQGAPSKNNVIGGTTSAEGNAIGRNNRYGIYILSGASYNTIGPNNVIAWNGSASYPEGIRLDGANTTHEVITRNSIYSNYGGGIALVNGANPNTSTPEVISANYSELTSLTQITGESAPPLGTVEVFMAEEGEGKTYLGSITADGSGNWSATFSGLVAGDVLVVTGTTANPETSEFSLTKEVITSVFKEYQPDNLIATLESYSDITGEAIYNTDGTNQTRTRSISIGASAVYYIKIENDANTTDEVIVKGIGASGDWALTYYDAKTGGNNITSSITGSGWSTGTLASGESKEIRMVAANSGSALSTLEALVTSESNTDSGKKDAVKAATTALPPPTALTSFALRGPSSAIASTPFSLTITAKDSTGATEETVIGTTTLSVDDGTITPESIAESAFTNGIWTGNVTLSKAGLRKVTAVNGSAVGTGEIIVGNATREFSSTELGIPGMSITVPAGAASEEVSISASIITAPPGDAPSGYYIGGSIFDIVSTPTEFLLPVTVTIPINGPLADPRVYYWNGTAWSREGIEVISTTTTSLTFTTTHFTVFAPMAASSNNLVRFGPNPYNPNSGQNAKIWYWLDRSYDTGIYIVDIAGNLVWKNNYSAGANGGRANANFIDFDGKDQWGNILGDGVYLYKIVQGGKSIGGGKIAIIKK
jgi:hypothetical protein